MENCLRILILEDEATDADLMAFELAEAGLSFTAKRVVTRNAFVKEMEAFAPDLILSDYDLPQYTGALALADAKAMHPDIPFILVTGVMKEDRACEIIALGARDYIHKNHMRRLAPAVRKALKEVEERLCKKQ
jgi:DNA-binding NtrC family response regulator